MNRKVRIDRLTKLVKILQTHKQCFPKIAWNMESFATCDHHKCATSACALGTAACDTGFKKAGLKLVDHPYRDNVWIVKFNGSNCFEAGAQFFGISGAESEWLFDPPSYHGDNGKPLHTSRVTEVMVVTRIKRLIKQYKKRDEAFIDGNFMDSDLVEFAGLSRYGVNIGA